MSSVFGGYIVPFLMKLFHLPQNNEENSGIFLTETYNSSHYLNGYDKCSICIENFKYKDIITLLLCKHMYHTSCVYEWFVQNAVCPLCRKEIKTLIV